MSVPDIGQLTAADEQLNHQIADTFAIQAVSDRGWTEKIWASLSSKDGSLQIDFGLGKYANRNVMDCFAGISRGAEQWTVRTSRQLGEALDETRVGPIEYEVLEPFKKIRFSVRSNKTVPIAFDVVFEAEMPAFFENRNKSRVNNRLAMDVIRYHQGGRVSGWLEIDGKREDVQDWFGFRDHSWGMRGDYIGHPPVDIEPNVAINRRMGLFWGPWLFTRPDGSKYEIQHFLMSTEHYDYYSGYVNHPDGRQEPIRRITPHVKFDKTNRYFLGGHFDLHLEDGTTRTVEVSPVGESGFHMRLGEYGSWKGGRHGAWRGEYHEDGEYIADCRKIIAEIGQFRDRPVRVKEGDAEGFGIQETIFVGDWPEHGLDQSSNYETNF
ncbi:DUF7065 domain-containing protein [Hyphomonas sp.]|uniref:DUF7065 domain-containing protein n=1 Tax=Hyphomonas sp. TaxID=87 RepID=UPI003F716F4D